MISMGIYVWLLHFLLVIKLILCTLADKCYVSGNIKILRGYRCFADSQMYFNITAIHHHLCRSRCITNRQCLFLQYKIEENYCIVANGPCLWLEPDTNYNITFIRTNPVENAWIGFPMWKLKMLRVDLNLASLGESCLLLDDFTFNLIFCQEIPTVVVYNRYSMAVASDMGRRNISMYNQDARCRGSLSPVETPFPTEQYKAAIWITTAHHNLFVSWWR